MAEGSNTITIGGGSKKKGPSPEVKKLTTEVGEVGRKVRILEERYSNIRRKAQMTEHNMLNIQKNLNKEMKNLDKQVGDLHKKILDVEKKMDQMLREINNFAKSEDLKILEKYVEFWEPLNFITREQAEKLIRDIIEENRKI